MSSVHVQLPGGSTSRLYALPGNAAQIRDGGADPALPHVQTPVPRCGGAGEPLLSPSPQRRGFFAELSVGSRGCSAHLHDTLMCREISRGRRVVPRPFVSDFSCPGGVKGAGGVLPIQPYGNGPPVPPFVVRFSTVGNRGHSLVVSDEDGVVTVVNTLQAMPRRIDEMEDNLPAITQSWEAHNNAVFDCCWTEGDSRIVTASGDQTMQLWDPERGKVCLGLFKGHRGSVKSVCPRPSNQKVLASGSRDGSVMLWDARTSGARPLDASNANVPSTAFFQSPVEVIPNAHLCASLAQKRKRRKKRGISEGVPVHSVTSVLFLRDGDLLASAGASDGVVKVWDLRKMQQPTSLLALPKTRADQAAPSSSARNSGIASLALDPRGSRLIAQSTDSVIYMYDVTNADAGPIRQFENNCATSFFTRVAFSPDGTHILSGSDYPNVYIWPVDGSPASDANPMVLEGHAGSVTGVDWCPTDFGKIATCADDASIRVWTINPKERPPTQDAGGLRKRVPARAIAWAPETHSPARTISFSDDPGSIDDSPPPPQAAGWRAANPAMRGGGVGAEVTESLVETETVITDGAALAVPNKGQLSGQEGHGFAGPDASPFVMGLSGQVTLAAIRLDGGLASPSRGYAPCGAAMERLGAAPSAAPCASRPLDYANTVERVMGHGQVEGQNQRQGQNQGQGQGQSPIVVDLTEVAACPGLEALAAPPNTPAPSKRKRTIVDYFKA